MKLATRAAAADTTEHRGIQRLTNDQERELGPRSQWIFNCEFPALSQPGKGGAQSINRAAGPGLVIFARKVWKPSRLAQNQLAATQQHRIHHHIDVAPRQLMERRRYIVGLRGRCHLCSKGARGAFYAAQRDLSKECFLVTEVLIDGLF